MTAVELRTLRARLVERVNEHLIDTKPWNDDRIGGFNDAWEVMTKFFDEEIEKVQT